MVSTGEMIPDSDRCQILDRFAQKMKNSGYGLNQIRRVILGGIKGYETLVRRSKKGERSLHRSSGESSALRTRKKLTGKSEWFRKSDKTDSDPEEKDSSIEIWLKAGNERKSKQDQNEKDRGMETRSVLFVEQSRKGELAKRLREVEKKVNRIVGYKTKIVEGVGNKLKDLLPNSNPWRGTHCGREKCIPCNQPTEQKQDCRKRNIIYENICLTCNPEAGTKVEKLDGKELEDRKEFPSIYVGESGRSLHERALEHWQDFEARQTDSHILKHWMVHHHGEGTPNFHIRVIKYCKDALSRQVGEAVRISYRGQTLNSKNGYNRSGLSRLVIEEKDEETLELPHTTDQPDPKGLPTLTGGWKAGKRDAGNPLVNQKSRKKRRKLKYAVMEDDWGLGDGEDLIRMENEEQAKKSFLKDGQTDCRAGKLEKQTTIKNWSESELICREIALESIAQSRVIGRFMSDLGGQLCAIISNRKLKIIQKDGALPSEPLKEDGLERSESTAKVQEGRKHQEGRQNTVKSLFAKQEHEKIKKLEIGLLKEERLENKRRLELKWKGMKSHAARLRWAREWLEEEILFPVIEAGNRKQLEADRLEARGVSNDILDMVLAEVKVHHDCGYSVACPGWWCMGMVQRKMTRRRPEGWKDAEQKKETLPEGRNPLKRGREPDGEWGSWRR